MLLYAAVFSIFAFWDPIKQVIMGEPAQWEGALESAKPFIVITIVFSILFGYRDYHKKRAESGEDVV